MIYLVFYALDKTGQLCYKAVTKTIGFVAPGLLTLSTKALERAALYYNKRNGNAAAIKQNIDVGRKDWWNQN
jgi:hypothetical protein